jgi:hypothetical protein
MSANDAPAGARMGPGILAALLAVGAVALTTSGTAAAPCEIAPDHGGLTFPVQRLTPEARCLAGAVLQEPTTHGTVGPLLTPVSRELHDYLLDHPVLTASLVRRLSLGPYVGADLPPDRFAVDDGDGTRGVFRLLHKDEANRIYHVEGAHRRAYLPAVKATALIFLRLKEIRGADGKPAVESSLVTYTRLNDPVLAWVVRALRPMIGEAVTHKLTRGFEALHQLGQAVSGDPQRALQELAAVSPVPAADLAALKPLLLQAHQATQAVQGTLPSSRPVLSP